jgi:hypothetical protein
MRLFWAGLFMTGLFLIGLDAFGRREATTDSEGAFTQLSEDGTPMPYPNPTPPPKNQ